MVECNSCGGNYLEKDLLNSVFCPFCHERIRHGKIIDFESIEKAFELEENKLIKNLAEAKSNNDEQRMLLCRGNLLVWQSCRDFIDELKMNVEKPIERGKHALDFLLWLIREVEAEYPASSRLLESLEAVRLDLQLFVKLEDTKKILEQCGEGEK